MVRVVNRATVEEAPEAITETVIASLARARSAGYEGVELSRPGGWLDVSALDFPPLSPYLPDEDRPVIELAAELAPAEAPELVSQIDELLHVGSRLGAQALNLSFQPSEGAAVHACYGTRYDAVAEALRGARLFAEQAGIMITVEAARDGMLASPVELRDLIDRPCAWPFGVCVDCGHEQRSRLADLLLTLRQRVRSLRLPDGAVVSDELASLLRAIRFEGVIIVAGDQPPESLDKLKQL